MTIKHKIAQLIATSFFVGKIKYFPGTFGSLVAFPICYIIMHVTLSAQVVFNFSGYTLEEQQIMSLFIISLLIVFLLFIVGLYATSIYIQDMDNKDPKEVVIDEVVGQMFVNILSVTNSVLIYDSRIVEYFSDGWINIIFLFFLPFFLFRLFDIIKPWPISWLDQNIKGAFGVMIDDIAAALFAVVTYYVAVFCILDWFPK